MTRVKANTVPMRSPSASYHEPVGSQPRPSRRSRHRYRRLPGRQAKTLQERLAVAFLVDSPHHQLSVSSPTFEPGAPALASIASTRAVHRVDAGCVSCRRTAPPLGQAHTTHHRGLRRVRPTTVGDETGDLGPLGTLTKWARPWHTGRGARRPGGERPHRNVPMLTPRRPATLRRPWWRRGGPGLVWR
jgi:hypothetical protein